MSDILQKLMEESESLRDSKGNLPRNWGDYYEALDKKTNEGNMFPAAIHPQIALDYLQKYLLGEDWYVTDPLPNMQVNAIVVDEILYKYSRRYRKEVKEYKKQKKKENKLKKKFKFW